jgi:hypothetical protein
VLVERNLEISTKEQEKVKIIVLSQAPFICFTA